MNHSVVGGVAQMLADDLGPAGPLAQPQPQGLLLGQLEGGGEGDVVSPRRRRRHLALASVASFELVVVAPAQLERQGSVPLVHLAVHSAFTA